MRYVTTRRSVCLALAGAALLGLAANGRTGIADDKTTSSTQAGKTQMSIEKSSFGKTKEGQEVTLYTCRNAKGAVLKLIDYGAIVVELHMPDRDGKLANINVGFDKLDGYLARHPYFGATVGRYANRIGGAKFEIDGKTYELVANDGKNLLHGGKKGFDAVLWKAEPVKTDSAVGVKFTYRSEDGEQGFPGNLDTTVTYLLTNDNELRIDYEAKTDKPTHVNLTNHNYWNLAGATAGSILKHEVLIAADKFVEVDSESIPTGDLPDVKGGVMDFTSSHAIGDRIKELTNKPQGYDHAYVLRGEKGKMKLAARVKEPTTGRIMEIHTTEPGIQFYTGNYLDGSEGGAGLKQHEAFCLETGHFPDSPNRPKFPSTLLRPGETYQTTTVHKFSAE